MRNASAFYLAIALALIFALLGIYYLVPGVYHPLSADTYGHTTPHLKYAAVLLALAILSLVAVRFIRPAGRT